MNVDYSMVTGLGVGSVEGIEKNDNGKNKERKNKK